MYKVISKTRTPFGNIWEEAMIEKDVFEAYGEEYFEIISGMNEDKGTAKKAKKDGKSEDIADMKAFSEGNNAAVSTPYEIK